MAKHLGIVPHLYAQPLFAGVKDTRSAAAQMFNLVEHHTAELSLQLRQGKLDGAFLSPIEYAKEYSHVRIVPNVGVVSEAQSQSVLLVFNEHLHNLKTIAVDPQFPTEIVLAHLVMMEKYHIKPQFVPMDSSLETMLMNTDAALVVDRNTLTVNERQNKLDLVDEWFDITEMPFVHGVWCSRELALNVEEIKALIANAQTTDASSAFTTEEKEYLANFRYTLDEEAIASINEFFRMAYYHGVLKDIPDVKFNSS